MDLRMSIAKYCLLAQFAATWGMVGLIWFVQVVHYPLMGRVGEREFAHYELLHQRLTSFVVGPLMLTELFATVVLLFWRVPSVPLTSAVMGAMLVAVIWIGTYTMQVPLHTALSDGFSLELHRRLVVGNWLRTVCWTARGVVVLDMLRRTIA